MSAFAPSCCEACGTPLTSDAVDGFCIDCLFRQGAAARLRPLFVPASTRPQWLGEYQILEELGRGAMGRVYRARQIRPDRPVALKVISTREMGAAERVGRFRIEAEAAAKLDHPNIVPVYDVGEQDEWHYFSMRLIEGETLSQRLCKAPLAFEATAHLLAKVARAIHHAHERGVLHRDIKPGNILLDARGEPHVADFGLAKIAESNVDLTLTAAALGTPAYMAPEQAAGRAKEITTAADIYSLGAVLFEMLTGRPPFVAESAVAVARLVIEEEPPPPASLNPATPPDLSVICLKCLEKRPGTRYPTAAALADDLERWLHHEPILAQSTSPWARFSKWMRRKPAHAALAGTIALAGLVLFLGLLWHNRRIASAQRATEAANRELAGHLRRAEWRQAEDALANGRTPDAMAMFARFLRETPGDVAAAVRLRSLLETRAFPLPASPPLKHRGQVTLARLGRDKRQIWTISDDGVLRVWSCATGAMERQAELELASDGLHLLPDAERLLLRTEQGKLLLWNIARWQREAELGETAASEHKWAISADSKWVSLVTPNGAVQLWDVAGRRLVAQTNTEARIPELATTAGPNGETIIRGQKHGAWLWRPHQPSLAPLLDPDEQLVCTVADWPRQRLYVSIENPARDVHGLICLDLQSGRELARNMTPLAWHRMEPSKDGTQLVASRWGIGATVIDAATLLDRFPRFGASPTFCTISPDPSFRVGFQALHDGSGRLYDLATSRPLMEPVQHSGTILSHQLSADATHVLTASQDGIARLWDVRMRPANTLLVERGLPVLCLGLSPDARSLAVGSYRDLAFYDAATGQPRSTRVSGQDDFNDVAFSQNGRFLAAANSDGTVRVLDPHTGTALWLQSASRGRVWRVSFSPDGRYLASGNEEGLVHIRDAMSGRLICPALQHGTSVSDVQFSPNGRWLATASMDSTARIWEAATGEPVSPPLRHQGSVWSARFSPDNKLLLTASYDRTAQLWSVETGQPAAPPIRGDTGLMGAVFSADGCRVLIFTLTGARIFDAHTLKPLTPPMLHGDKNSRVRAAAFSPDGRWVATACEDGTARMWDAASGYPISEPLRHGREVSTLVWLPDSRRLITGSFDLTIRHWTLPEVGLAPAWLPELAEALAGQRNERDGGTLPVPAEQLERFRRQALTNSPVAEAHWLHWFFVTRLQEPTTVPGRARE